MPVGEPLVVLDGDGRLRFVPGQRTAATGPTLARLIQNRSIAEAMSPGRPAARMSTASVDWPKVCGPSQRPGVRL
jgi:hypothetical protein